MSKTFKKESEYQAYLKRERIPEILGNKKVCKILKNDAQVQSGVPDLTVIKGNKWAWLEVKKSKDEPHRPGQDENVEFAKRNSFGSFIYPENENEVLTDLKKFMDGNN